MWCQWQEEAYHPQGVLCYPPLRQRDTLACSGQGEARRYAVDQTISIPKSEALGHKAGEGVGTEAETRGEQAEGKEHIHGPLQERRGQRVVRDCHLSRPAVGSRSKACLRKWVYV
jgi:hypothetical protein